MHICIYVFGEDNGTPLQYFCLENPMDGGAWWAAVYGVAQSQTWLSYFTFTFQFHALEKEMATHSSVLAWRIPVTGEPGGLPSMGLHRVRHDWSDLLNSNSSFVLFFFELTIYYVYISMLLSTFWFIVSWNCLLHRTESPSVKRWNQCLAEASSCFYCLHQPLFHCTHNHCF